jgi:pantetheine-phosphate adenylyltransferase
MTRHPNCKAVIITQSASVNKSSQQFRLVGVGGTFDVLHRGHRRLLRKAFSVGTLVMIGLTSDSFARNLHKPHKVDPYSIRKEGLEKLLSKWGLLSRVKIMELTDRHGLTVGSRRIQALVVSKRTSKTAFEINKRRKANGLKPLAIIPIDLILAEDNRPISSTRIRRGQIDREGRLVSSR